MQLSWHLLTTTFKHNMKFITNSLTTKLTHPLFPGAPGPTTSSYLKAVSPQPEGGERPNMLGRDACGVGNIPKDHRHTAATVALTHRLSGKPVLVSCVLCSHLCVLPVSPQETLLPPRFRALSYSARKCSGTLQLRVLCAGHLGHLQAPYIKKNDPAMVLQVVCQAGTQSQYLTSVHSAALVVTCAVFSTTAVVEYPNSTLLNQALLISTWAA
jgi:hypothetical protein